MLICGGISGAAKRFDGRPGTGIGCGGETAILAAARLPDILQGSERAVVFAFGLGAKPEVVPEARVLFVGERLGHASRSARVMASHVFAELAVDAPDAHEVPVGGGELLDERGFQSVGRLPGLNEIEPHRLEACRVLGLQDKIVGLQDSRSLGHASVPFCPRVSTKQGWSLKFRFVIG